MHSFSRERCDPKLTAQDLNCLFAVLAVLSIEAKNPNKDE